MTLFILMFLAHCIDDFFLQGGCLVNLRQKSWWQKQTTDAKYSKDYLMGLFIHAFEWSAMLCLVLMMFGASNWFLAGSFFINGFVHMFVDDLKANRFKINLIQDQLIHLVQITTTVILFYFI